LAKATAANAIACSLCARNVGKRSLAPYSASQPRDIAVTENRESASKKEIFSAVDLARLRREEADERLGHREPDCGHFSSLKSDISLQGPRTIRGGCHIVYPLRPSCFLVGLRANALIFGG